MYQRYRREWADQTRIDEEAASSSRSRGEAVGPVEARQWAVEAQGGPYAPCLRDWPQRKEWSHQEKISFVLMIRDLTPV